MLVFGAWYAKASAGFVASLSSFVARFSFSCFGSEMSGSAGFGGEGIFPKSSRIFANVGAGSKSPVTTRTALLGT